MKIILNKLLNGKLYIVTLLLITAFVAGIASSTFAKEEMKKIINTVIPAYFKPIILNIGPDGKVLVRGLVVSVESDSIVIKTWGGEWKINFDDDTDFDFGSKNKEEKIEVNDFLGVHGQANQNNKTINASFIKNWTKARKGNEFSQTGQRKPEKTGKPNIQEKKNGNRTGEMYKPDIQPKNVVPLDKPAEDTYQNFPRQPEQFK